jgi:hypothetical protein
MDFPFLEPTEDTDEAREVGEALEAVIPQSVWQQIRRTFTPRGMPFFQFYLQLKSIALGAPVPDDIKMQWTRSANYLIQVTSPVDHRTLSPVVVNRIAEIRSDMGMLLGRLLAGRTNDAATWRKLNDLYVPLIVAACRDKGIYLRARQMGRERWASFRKMTESQETVERLQDTDPESYQLMQQYGKALSQIDAGIRKKIERAGLDIREGAFMGRPVLYGVDKNTGEERIYDRDGEVLTKEDYIAKREAKEKADLKLARVPTRTTVPLEDLRSLPDEKLDRLTGQIDMMSLSDDLAKQGKLTRIFATKRLPVFVAGPDETTVEYHAVVISGRYKGIYVDDLVNSEGRLIEGTAYTYNPGSGRSKKLPKRLDPAQREPYATLAETPITRMIRGQKVTTKEKRLFLKIPGTRQFTELRHAIKSLACNTGTKRGCIPSVVFQPVEGSNAVSFYFEAKDFGVIMETLKGMSLSTSALRMIEEYYKDLARAEMATAEHNLSNYSAPALGGFKTSRKNRETGQMEPIDLTTRQKQALAWLDANGNRGVCGLDTGVGKTLTSVAMIRKMTRDGLADADATYKTPDGKEVQTNGRFLYVCPPSLKGNFEKEVRNFISVPADVLERTDIVTYKEFAGSSKSGKVPRMLRNVAFWKNRDWDPALYVSVFFDEAQELTSLTSQVSQAALKLWHPRKMCLTGSPMEGNPMEAYILGAVSNNLPLFGNDLEAENNREEMRRFRDRYCEVVGGRIIGVKDDPLVKRDLDTWVKRNIFYADKTEVEELALPQLRPQTVVAEMHPVVETAYRGVTKQFAALMGGMVAKFRDKGGPGAANPDLEAVFSRAFAPLIHLLNDLSNSPDTALEDLATMLETGNLPPVGDNPPMPVPDILIKPLKKLSALVTPTQLRDVTAVTPNVKLLTAEEFIRSKMERTNGSSRALLFSDDPRLCLKSVLHMSKTILGLHAVALKDRVLIYDGGMPLSEMVFEIDPGMLAKYSPEQVAEFMRQTQGVSRIPLPVVKKMYRKFPMLPVHDPENLHYRADRWQEFALKELVVPNEDVRSLTLYGPSYQYGHNLQAFDTVIHLDRDSWNSETMKQRTARAWRQGQSQPVDEITLDASYAASDGGVPRDEFDKTLDEIRRYFQEMQSDIFDRIIRDAQSVRLGAEWAAIAKKDASRLRLDRKVMELMASPYVGRSTPPGV